MAVVPRIWRTNVMTTSSVTLSSLDEQATFPSIWLKDQLRSKRYRSNVGWTIGAGFNDTLLVGTTDGKRIAHIVPGIYATGSSMAAAVQTALGVAGLTPLSASSSSLTFWWRGDSVVLDSAGLAQTLVDLGPGTRNLTQATSGNRYTWASNAIGSRPGIYSSGTALMGYASTGTAADFFGSATGQGTIFAVYIADSDTPAISYIWSVSSAGTAYAASAWVTATSALNSYFRNTAGTLFTVPKVSGTVSALNHGEWEYDQVNLQTYSNDSDSAAAATTGSTGAMNATGLASTFQVGAGSLGSPMKGYLLELIVYNIPLTEDQRRKVVQYLRGRYQTLVDATTAPTWSNAFLCTYSSGSNTSKFNITSSSGPSFSIQVTTTSGYQLQDFYASIAKDLGYTADMSAATTQTGAQAVYQSRHWVKADLTTGNSTSSWTTAAIIDHNITTGGTVTLKDNSLDLWTTGPSTRDLTSISNDGEIRFDYMSTGAANRWWRVEVNDVTNTGGYIEFGVWYVGTYITPTRAYASEMDPGYGDLSVVQDGAFGATHVDERSQRDRWSLLFTNVTTSGYDDFVTLRRITPVGRAFLFAFDASGTPTDLKYVELASEIHTPHTKSKSQYRIEMSIREALGT